MSEKIIGRGTWYDKTAVELLERERKLQRSLDLIRTEMGIGISGIPHIGHIGDASRAYALTLAIQTQGHNSEMIAFADDKDGLRKVPAGLPSELEKYLGFPVRSIPDPFKCHGSFAEHMIDLLLEAFDKCGIEYKLMSAEELYKNGVFNKEIEMILKNAKRVGELIREEIGQEKFEEKLPSSLYAVTVGAFTQPMLTNFCRKKTRFYTAVKEWKLKASGSKAASMKAKQTI